MLDDLAVVHEDDAIGDLAREAHLVRHHDNSHIGFGHTPDRRQHLADQLGVENPKMDALLDGARSELDQSKREAMYHRIVDMTLDECPIIDHCNTNNVQIYNTKLSGFVPSPQEYRETQGTITWS
jgi:ABC-type transport system substrate-binding protein